MAEWLGRGLQNPLRGFESHSVLHLARNVQPAPCQSVHKKNFVFCAIALDLIVKDVILNVMKVKVRKTGIFSKARPHKRVNKVLPRRQKHKKKLDLS